MPGPEDEPVPGAATGVLELGEDGDEVDDFAGEFFEGEGEVGHGGGDFVFCRGGLVEGEVVVVKVFEG